MELALTSAAAWFFVSSSHYLDGSLVVRLVEGIKATDREFVDVGHAKLGPYFPVRVQAESRIAEVRFTRTLAFCILDESYDTGDPKLERGPGRFLFSAEKSSFRSSPSQPLVLPTFTKRLTSSSYFVARTASFMCSAKSLHLYRSFRRLLISLFSAREPTSPRSYGFEV